MFIVSENPCVDLVREGEFLNFQYKEHWWSRKKTGCGWGKVEHYCRNADILAHIDGIGYGSLLREIEGIRVLPIPMKLRPVENLNLNSDEEFWCESCPYYKSRKENAG